MAGFFGAVTAVIVTALTGGNFVLGMAAGGAVAGAILGGVSGGWEGALKGAAMGFVIGGAMGIGLAAGGAYFAAGALIAGATYAGVTGGAEGLGDFAAGVLGSMSGYYAGSAMVHGTTNLTSAGTPRNVATSAKAAGIKTPSGEMGKGSTVAALNTDGGSIASGAQALSSTGTEGSISDFTGFGKNIGPGGYYDDLGMFRLTVGSNETASQSQLNQLNNLLNAKARLGTLQLLQKSQGIIRHLSSAGDVPEGAGSLSDFIAIYKVYSASKTSAQVAAIQYEIKNIQTIRNEKSLLLFTD